MEKSDVDVGCGQRDALQEMAGCHVSAAKIRLTLIFKFNKCSRLTWWHWSCNVLTQIGTDRQTDRGSSLRAQKGTQPLMSRKDIFCISKRQVWDTRDECGSGAGSGRLIKIKLATYPGIRASVSIFLSHGYSIVCSSRLQKKAKGKKKNDSHIFSGALFVSPP